MIYLKEFENHAAYTAAESGLILPNVSLCVQENEVHYKPYIDPCTVYDYVDLGLPSGTLWATKNVGACTETDYGNYYKYGSGATQYSADTSELYYTGAETPLAISADTAAQVWGGDWHTPTKAQFEELILNSTYHWTSNFNGSGVKGGIFRSNKDNSKYIFFPASGYYKNGSESQIGNVGKYWSSTFYNSNTANILYFVSVNDKNEVNSEYRYHGLSIRPVIG